MQFGNTLDLFFQMDEEIIIPMAKDLFRIYYNGKQVIARLIEGRNYWEGCYVDMDLHSLMKLERTLLTYKFEKKIQTTWFRGIPKGNRYVLVGSLFEVPISFRLYRTLLFYGGFGQIRCAMKRLHPRRNCEKSGAKARSHSGCNRILYSFRHSRGKHSTDWFHTKEQCLRAALRNIDGMIYIKRFFLKTRRLDVLIISIMKEFSNALEVDRLSTFSMRTMVQSLDRYGKIIGWPLPPDISTMGAACAIAALKALQTDRKLWLFFDKSEYTGEKRPNPYDFIAQYLMYLMSKKVVRTVREISQDVTDLFEKRWGENLGIQTGTVCCILTHIVAAMHQSFAQGERDDFSYVFLYDRDLYSLLHN